MILPEDLVARGIWPMLRHLVDGSAPEPTKDVANCDKPRLGACGLRTGDF